VTATTEVLVHRPGPGIVELVLDGPPLNILSASAQHRLTEVLTELHADDGLDAVLVTGGGDRAFSVGADLRDEQNTAGGHPWGGATLAEHWTTLLASLPALTIAVVEGHCLGGGLELALCADLRIAGPDATFGLPEVRIGLIPGMGATVRLPALVGPAWATRMLMTGATVDASTAARIGLVQAVDPAPRELALSWLRQLEPAAPLARRTVKSLVARGSGYPEECRAWQVLAGTADAAEGRDAFLEHRAARFRGR
jgi:enoyl-CoA hydratase